MDRQTARKRANACMAIEGMDITAEDMALFAEMDALGIDNYDDRIAFIIARHKQEYQSHAV